MQLVNQLIFLSLFQLICFLLNHFFLSMSKSSTVFMAIRNFQLHLSRQFQSMDLFFYALRHTLQHTQLLEVSFFVKFFVIYAFIFVFIDENNRLFDLLKLLKANSMFLSLQLDDLIVIRTQDLIQIILVYKMKKTQPIQPARSTFKGLLNVQQQKLPERNKSRSRSVRNRNNTTSNFTVSRATQHDQTIPDQHSNINGQNNWGTTEGYYQKSQTNEVEKKGAVMKFEENVSSNLSKNQSSISNIREKMRKESAELQERERNRSHSRRRRSNNTSAIQSNQSRQKPGNRSREEHTSKSRQKHVSKFPNAIHKQCQPSHPQSKDSPQYQQKQLNSLKSQLKTIQTTYSIFRKQMQQLYAHNVESSSILSGDELKLRAEELNNQLEQFSFSFKENINGKTKEILGTVENCIRSRNIARGGNQQDHDQGEQSDRQDQKDNQIGRVFDKVQRHFGINKNNSKNNTKGIFQIMTQSTNNSYSQIQRKLLLAQDRLLK